MRTLETYRRSSGTARGRSSGSAGRRAARAGGGGGGGGGGVGWRDVVEGGVGQEERGRGDPGVDEQEDDADQLVLRERDLVVAAALEEGGDQVLGGLGPGGGGQLLGVLDEADERFTRPAAVTEGEVPHPGAHLVAVTLLHADQLADDLGGQGVGEGAQEVRTAVLPGLFPALGHETVRGPLDEGAQGRDAAGGERAGQRGAAAGVLLAVEE